MPQSEYCQLASDGPAGDRVRPGNRLDRGFPERTPKETPRKHSYLLNPWANVVKTILMYLLRRHLSEDIKGNAHMRNFHRDEGKSAYMIVSLY